MILTDKINYNFFKIVVVYFRYRSRIKLNLIKEKSAFRIKSKKNSERFKKNKLVFNCITVKVNTTYKNI